MRDLVDKQPESLHIEMPQLEVPKQQCSHRVPGVLKPVVADLDDKRAIVVTLDDLAAYEVDGHTPSEIAQILRRSGWLFPLRCRGAWRFCGFRLSWETPGYEELRARLRVRPDTQACIAGKSVAQAHSWLRRPVMQAIGVPPRVKVPRCLDDYTICRWKPQIPLDEINGLPVWKPETLLVFMGARPASFVWGDIAEWLWEACENLDKQLLLSELKGRSRAAWMKTAYIIESGERPDLADTLLGLAPSNTKGPYLFADKTYWHGSLDKRLDWSAKYEVLDYVFPRWWMEKWR